MLLVLSRMGGDTCYYVAVEGRGSVTFGAPLSLMLLCAAPEIDRANGIPSPPPSRLTPSAPGGHLQLREMPARHTPAYFLT